MRVFVCSAAAVAMLTAAGCDQAQGAMDDIARDQARSVVSDVAAQTAPGVNVAPYTDCVIDNASSGEIFTIARAAITGANADTVNLVADIARRPASLACLAQASLATL